MKREVFYPKKLFTTGDKNEFAYGSCRSCPVASPDKKNMVTVPMCHPYGTREQRQDGEEASMDNVSLLLAKTNKESMTNKPCKSCSSHWIPHCWALVCTGSSHAVSTALLCWRSVLLLLLLSIPLLLVSSAGLSWASFQWAPQFWPGWCHPQLLLSPWQYQLLVQPNSQFTFSLLSFQHHVP